MKSQTTRCRLSTIGVFVGILCCIACSDSSNSGAGSEPFESLAKTRGYVLISIDTLRADHVGAYGYSRDTSPFLDSLAEQGVLFEQAVAQIPSTLPSHVSMLTGLYPKEHRVYPPDGVIPVSIETLPEIFQSGGFHTGGFTDGGYMSGSFGFARGFDTFGDSVEVQEENRRVEKTFGKGLEFVRSLSESEPFFLFLHTYSVHDPYDPPQPYRTLYWEGRAPLSSWEPTGPNLSRFNCGHEMLSDEERDYFVSLYDAGIRYTDDVLADFFTQLHEIVSALDLTVIITSDHGEEFVEHGLLSHAQVYHHNLHVPLIVMHPGAKPQRVHGLARLIDIAPTFVDLAGLEVQSQVTGESLRAPLEGRPYTGPELSYAQASVGGGQAIYRAEGPDRVLQYLSQPQRGAWITPRGLVFDSSAPVYELGMHSLLEPRMLQIEIDGEARNEILIESLITKQGSDPVQTIGIPIPQDGRKHRVRLVSDTCAPASSVGSFSDCRCLSINVAGLPAQREEFYDAIRDPLEQVDLSIETPRALPALAHSLDEANRSFEAVAEPQTRELDPDVEKRLRALGYL